jgi:hypothetical protein
LHSSRQAHLLHARAFIRIITIILLCGIIITSCTSVPQRSVDHSAPGQVCWLAHGSLAWLPHAGLAVVVHFVLLPILTLHCTFEISDIHHLNLHVLPLPHLPQPKVQLAVFASLWSITQPHSQSWASILCKLMAGYFDGLPPEFQARIAKHPKILSQHSC